MPSHGSKAKFFLAEVDLSPYLSSAGLTPTRDSSEVTTFGNNSKRYIPGLKDGGSIPLSGEMDNSLTNLILGWYSEGDLLNFRYEPGGNTTPFMGVCFVEEATWDSDVSESNKFEVSLKVTGDVTRGVTYDYNFDDQGEFVDFDDQGEFVDFTDLYNEEVAA